MDISKFYSLRELAIAGDCNYMTAYSARTNGELPMPDVMRGARMAYSEVLAEKVIHWMKLDPEGREIARTRTRLAKMESASKGGAK